MSLWHENIDFEALDYKVMGVVGSWIIAVTLLDVGLLDEDDWTLPKLGFDQIVQGTESVGLKLDIRLLESGHNRPLARLFNRFKTIVDFRV